MRSTVLSAVVLWMPNAVRCWTHARSAPAARGCCPRRSRCWTRRSPGSGATLGTEQRPEPARVRLWSLKPVSNDHKCTLAGVSRWVHLRSEEHTSELQSRFDLVCRLLLEKKKNK